MGTERKRIFRAIQELAAHGEGLWDDLSTDFVTPGDILNADQAEGVDGT